jgi:AraC family transcriptional regulator of adaptative response/methylated-DNA-[protein]-cysteine methyltransferase
MGYTGGMSDYPFSQQARDYQRVEQAIRFLEAHAGRQPSLDEIAASVHLSKYHFQRLFKRWAGLSPTQFLGTLTVAYAKERLAASRSVLDTALDAGLSGPGRLHDLFVTFEAVTPGEYKGRGTGLEIRYGVHATPFGPALLATTARGICGLHFLPEPDPSAARDVLARDWPQARLVEASGRTRPVVERIFAPLPPGESRPFHLLLKGTNFQVQVWQALLAIPPGALVSYGDVAAYLGRPGASRAVAGAMARNPIAYLIPCHRVIRRNGQLHRYRWGTARKMAMVGWEAGLRAQP